ncbi:KIR-like protein [Plasmodium knowlesi strain H]|uniref:KIR-like protein n=3 Tax=Plasmodium knowlesi TaxID=5850 RepID=A0A1A7VD24_PLAKH|nr:KIR-like protein [Plasmodium knowlesi strain H]OTN67758.1 KIR-like protein [Plasmodium knowlesi]CAA9990467.1 KIR-like protein [Plasmodium knowlesi strain H]SBO19676.1 KIR-like protein [Plasmodium knowlesi strain H]SBO22496.1 KIR-like protein [Plasmodium knowlesi strain H]VVS79941.1 KIR-like protein [Plasmodium knowlesi strain H]
MRKGTVPVVQVPNADQHCSDNLPSEGMWRELIKNVSKSYCNSGEGIWSGISGYVGGYTNKTAIVGAYCYAKGKKEEKESPFSNMGCDFLYYYIGNLINYGGTTHTSFQKAISALYDTLKEHSNGWECTNTYKIVEDKTIFDHLKKLFDYTQDHNHIKEKISQEKVDRACFEKYKTYLQDANGACAILKKQCPITSSGGTSLKEYCTLYQRVCNGNNTNPSELLVQLTTAEKKFQQPQVEGQGELETVTSTKELTDEHLNVVKATLKLYVEFDTGSDDCGNSSIVPSIKSTISKHTTVENPAEAVVKAWCYAHNKWRDVTSSNDARCHSLYYWIGDKVQHGGWNVHGLGKLMKELYQKLGKWKFISGCTNLYENIEKEEFYRRKKNKKEKKIYFIKKKNYITEKLN